MATGKAPGRHHRKGITLMDAVRKFDTEEKAEAWFVEQRWPNGLACPHCGSVNVATIENRKPQPYRCRDCRKHFSVRTGTCLHASNIPLSKWAIAVYLYSTNLKGLSSMKLHRDLGIGQKAAWYMAHRIRTMWKKAEGRMKGPVEVDEVYIGGKDRNKHSNKRLRVGGGMGGKTPVVGAKDRATKQVSVKVLDNATAPAVVGFVESITAPGTMIYTDGSNLYNRLPRPHEAVEHTAGEYVRGEAHTKGIESLWAMTRRTIMGTYHKVSKKHLPRYMTEMEGRHNLRPLDTADQMAAMARGMSGKVGYRALVSGYA